MSRGSLGSVGSEGTSPNDPDRQFDDLWRRMATAERERDRAVRERDEAISAKDDLERESAKTIGSLRADCNSLQQRSSKLQSLAEDLGEALKVSQKDTERLKDYVAELEELLAANRHRKNSIDLEGNLEDELAQGPGNDNRRNSRGSVFTARTATTDVSTLEDELRQASDLESEAPSGSSCTQGLITVEPGGDDDAAAGEGQAAGSREPMDKRPSEGAMSASLPDFLASSHSAKVPSHRTEERRKKDKELAEMLHKKNREIRKLKRRLAEYEDRLHGASSSGVFDSLFSQLRDMTMEASSQPRSPRTPAKTSANRSPRLPTAQTASSASATVSTATAAALGSGGSAAAAGEHRGTRSSVSTTSSNGWTCRVHSPTGTLGFHGASPLSSAAKVANTSGTPSQSAASAASAPAACGEGDSKGDGAAGSGGGGGATARTPLRKGDSGTGRSATPGRTGVKVRLQVQAERRRSQSSTASSRREGPRPSTSTSGTAATAISGGSGLSVGRSVLKTVQMKPRVSTTSNSASNSAANFTF